MIDSHCHLDFKEFDDNRDKILQNCQKLGIKKILIPGTKTSGFTKQRQLAKCHSELDIAFGLHPYFLESSFKQSLDVMASMIAQHREEIVAVGEIGLDLAITERVSFKLQKQAFQSQLALAKQYQLPVILHHRKSHNELIQILKLNDFRNGGVVHAFSGSLQVARQYIEMGFKLGVGGTITYPRAQKTRETIAQVPLDTLLLETDAPDMPLCGKQGQVNSPLNLPEIVASLCELRSETEHQIVTQTTQTYQALFNLNLG